MPGIFINYRREDTAAYAGRIYDRLSAHFGTQSVFMDVDAITPGMDFETLIENKLQSSAVMIVLIGEEWLKALDSSGSVRLDNQADFVRREIAAALSRNILVIPVLVEGAIMPRPQDLPDPLKPLLRRQALQISDSRFHKDIGDLISLLDSVNSTAKESNPAASMIPAFIEKIKHPKLYSVRFAVVALVVSIVVAVLLLQQWYPRTSNISGDWIAEVPKIQEDGKAYAIRFTFFTAGDALRGTVSRDTRFRSIFFGYGPIQEGKIDGDNIFFKVKNMLDKGGYIGGPSEQRYQEQLYEATTVFQGRVTGNVIHFDVPENGSGPLTQFTAVRVNP